MPDTKTIQCLSCKAELELDDEFYQKFVGKNIKCPACQADIWVAEGEVIKTRQPTVPIKQKRKCPRCNQIEIVESVFCMKCGYALNSQQTANQPASTTNAPEEKSPANQTRPRTTCPNCFKAVKSNDVICVGCGTKLLTGRKAKLTLSLKEPEVAQRSIYPIISSSERQSRVGAGIAKTVFLVFFEFVIKLLFIAFICVVVGLIVAYILTSRSSKQEGASTKQTTAVSPAPQSPSPAIQSMSLLDFAKAKVGKAYYGGWGAGVSYGGLDRKFGSYDNIAKSQTDVVGSSMMLSESGIKSGTSESGDFWEGYDEGYQSGRNNINLGRFSEALEEGIKAGYKD